MEYAEIVEKVKAIIVDKLGVEPSEVTETANFTNDLGAEPSRTLATKWPRSSPNFRKEIV